MIKASGLFLNSAPKKLWSCLCQFLASLKCYSWREQSPAKYQGPGSTQTVPHQVPAGQDQTTPHSTRDTQGRHSHKTENASLVQSWRAKVYKTAWTDAPFGGHCTIFLGHGPIQKCSPSGQACSQLPAEQLRSNHSRKTALHAESLLLATSTLP